MNPTFSFTKLAVHDLEKQAAFYRDVYGLQAVQRVQAEIGSEAIDEIMLSPDPNAQFGPLILVKFLMSLKRTVTTFRFPPRFTWTFFFTIWFTIWGER